MLNEYQEALDTIVTSEIKFCKDYGCFTPDKEFVLLQKLVDKATPKPMIKDGVVYNIELEVVADVPLAELEKMFREFIKLNGWHCSTFTWKAKHYHIE